MEPGNGGMGNKDRGPEDRGLVIPRRDLICQKLIKQFPTRGASACATRDPNSKIQTMSRLGGFWSLGIGI